jgi:hypothetical protein
MKRTSSMPRFAVLLPAIIVLAASLPAVAFPCSLIEEGSFRLDSMPSANSGAFPHDGAPLIRIGDMRSNALPEDFRPAILDDAGEEVPTTVEQNSRADEFQGATSWLRVIPDEILAADADFTLKLVTAEDSEDAQTNLDATFPPVSFRTGRSFIEDEPVAPEFTIQVLDHAATPPVIHPCGVDVGDAWVETRVHNVSVAADAAAFDVWRFFVVSDSLGDDLLSENHRVAVDADMAVNAGHLVNWSDAPSAADDGLCVIAVTEDAYGRTSVASEPSCADAIPACQADCSAVGDRTSASLASLLLLAVLGLRRLRRR